MKSIIGRGEKIENVKEDDVLDNKQENENVKENVSNEDKTVADIKKHLKNHGIEI